MLSIFKKSTLLTLCVYFICIYENQASQSNLPTCKSLVATCLKDREKGCNVWSKVAALYNPRFVCEQVLEVITPLTKDPGVDYLPGCIAGCGRAQVFHPAYCRGPCM